MDEATPAPSANKSPPDWERSTLEKLLMATVREQRAARRWRIFFRLLWLSVFVFIVAMLMRDYATRATLTQPHTALIEVRGVIASDAPANAPVSYTHLTLPTNREV